MFPSLPYDYYYLDDDADDERVESIIRKVVCFIRLVGYEQTGGRDKEYHESDDEGRSWICFEVVLQSLEVRSPLLFPVGWRLKDKASLPLNPSVIRVESHVSACQQCLEAAWHVRLVVPSITVCPPDHQD